MRLWGSHGRRPAGFYEFEFDGPRPAYNVERSTLWRAGVLSAGEKGELEGGGEGGFERGYAPHFFHHDRGGGLPCEPPAPAPPPRADVPRELTRRWAAARKRRSGRQPAPSSEEAVATK